MRHRGERAHGAGRHHHRVALKRAARNGGADSVHRVHHIGQRFNLGAPHVEFLLQIEQAGRGHGQMGLYMRQFSK